MPPGYTIKQTPADFIVEEVTDIAFDPTGPYAVVEARKEGLNTEAAKRILADAFHIQEDDVAYAGLKDKRARTSQLFSLRHVGEDAIARFSHPQLAIRFLGYRAQPLYVGVHSGNRFTIRVTIENLGARVAYDRGVSRIAAKPWLVNYFDEQRFSTQNVAIGVAIIKKDFATAAKLAGEHCGRDGDGLRAFLEEHPTNPVGALGKLPREILVLFIHAAQSRIWNNALSAFVKGHAGDAPGAVRLVPYSQGTLAFPDDPRFLEGIAVPLAGFGRASDPRFDDSIEDEMAALGISDRDFIVRQLPAASSEGGNRQALVPIGGFCAKEESKTKVTFGFELPKGSYATMVLRQIFGE